MAVGERATLEAEVVEAQTMAGAGARTKVVVGEDRTMAEGEEVR